MYALIVDGSSLFFAIKDLFNDVRLDYEKLIAHIEKEIGENAGIGEQVVTMLGENKLQVVLQVSELDVSKIVSGSEVKIKLDALPGEEFSGVLSTINSRDTQIDGVSVYEAFVELQPDSRIKTGMTATGTIIIITKNDVLAIPNYFIKKSGDRNLVKVKSSNGKITEKEIVVGIVGTDSMTEVVSGLNEGDQVVSVK